jgi:cholesterol transport system auxiliary component
MNTIGRTVLLLAALGVIAGCASRPDEPVRSYDFGPSEAPQPPALAIHVREVGSPEWLDRPEMLYRLGYRDPRALEPYAFSRWAGTPASMLTLKLRQAFGNVEPRAARCILAVDLEEFSQVFDSERSSRAVLRARAVLRETAEPRRFDSMLLRLERPAPTPNAAGGAAAFSALADEMPSRLRDWTASLAYCQ